MTGVSGRARRTNSSCGSACFPRLSQPATVSTVFPRSSEPRSSISSSARGLGLYRVLLGERGKAGSSGGGLVASARSRGVGGTGTRGPAAGAGSGGRGLSPITARATLIGVSGGATSTLTFGEGGRTFGEDSILPAPREIGRAHV